MGDLVTDDSASILDELGKFRPRLARTILKANENRRTRLTALLNGARFAGLDEMLRHLDSLWTACEATPATVKIAFLIERCTADFETAIEATLSGYMAVAADSMRDVMEIENLMRDFALNPSHVDEWLTGSSAIRRRKFAPRAVRARLHAGHDPRFTDSPVSIDYRAHSEALHVTPHRHPIAIRGVSTEQGWGGDAGFWEIFEHFRRLHDALERIISTVAKGSELDRVARSDLPDVRDAWKRTQEMQSIFMALMQAAVKSEGSEQ